MIYTELKLFMYRLLITIMFLILSYSVAYCQVIQEGNGFKITREYAEFIALKFDSLDAYKQAYKQAVQAADTCNSILNYAQSVIKEQDMQYKMQLRQIQAQSEMIESYKRSEFAYIDMQKQLKTETRKRKAWKVTAVTFISLFSASLIYIAI